MVCGDEKKMARQELPFASIPWNRHSCRSAPITRRHYFHAMRKIAAKQGRRAVTARVFERIDNNNGAISEIDRLATNPKDFRCPPLCRAACRESACPFPL